MSDRIMVTMFGCDIEVEFDGFEDEIYGNHYEVRKVVIDGLRAEELLGESVRRKVEEKLHAVVNGLVEEEL